MNSTLAIGFVVDQSSRWVDLRFVIECHPLFVKKDVAGENGIAIITNEQEVGSMDCA